MENLPENGHRKNSIVFNNAKWIIVCKIIQSVLQLIVGVLCARYMGPSNYGLINYAKSLVAFVLPLMQLGLDATLVQELVDAPEREGEIMGTALLMNLFSGLGCMFLVIGFVKVANPGETVTLIVCSLYSLSLIFQALEQIKFWFYGKLKAKYPSIMMVVSYIAVFAYRIYLLATAKSVYWFALVSVLEYGVISVGLLIFYQRVSTQKLRITLKTVRALFSKSKYYIIASLMFMGLKNIDHIMLKLMVGEAENGVYTAAITSGCFLQFVFYAIIDSMRPVILAHKKENAELYETGVSRLYCVLVYLALAQSVAFAIFARPIVMILFGADYSGAIPVLRILIWYLALAYIAEVRNIWILAENKHNRLWKINLCGLLANVALNAFMIPKFGACGAAISSVITQFFANVVVGFLMKDIRHNNSLMLEGLRWRTVKAVFREVKESLRA